MLDKFTNLKVSERIQDYFYTLRRLEMQKLQSFGIAMAIFCLLFLVNSSYAIEFEYIGHSSGSNVYGFTGDTLYGQANFDEPYSVVYWYVDKIGDDKPWTLISTDNGNGIVKGSYFSHTFDEGSTSGEGYEITALVYAANGVDINQESYNVVILTPPEEVITVPDELEILDDIKIGDAYAFKGQLSSNNSGYKFSDGKIKVDGVETAVQILEESAKLAFNYTGIIPENVGVSGGGLTVYLWAKGTITTQVVTRLLGPTAVIAFTMEVTWRGMLVGTLEGTCTCADDDNPLDTGIAIYECGDPAVRYRFQNRTSVRWYPVDKFLSFGGSRVTLNNGRYSFVNKVPMGYDIIVTVISKDLHVHTRYDEYFNELPAKKLICYYSSVRHIGKIGKVFLKKIPYDMGGGRDQDFSLVPHTVKDPCTIPKSKRVKEPGT